MGQRALVVLLVGAMSVPVTAVAQEGEEDDPAFARKKPPPQQQQQAEPENRQGAETPSPEEPELDPVPIPDADPVPAPAPVPVADAAAAPVPASASAPPLTLELDEQPVRLLDEGDSRRGLRVRLAYRQLTLPEVKDMEQTLGDDTFHAVAFDVFPFSGILRIGLSTQLALESGGDFLASEGLTLALTHPSSAWTPFVEGGIHAGLGQRSVWIPTETAPRDFPTLFLIYTGEAGVDFHLGGEAIWTLAVGLQRSSFFLSLADPMEPVTVIYDTTFTFKAGIGY
jgi:hypothetical protein